MHTCGAVGAGDATTYPNSKFLGGKIEAKFGKKRLDLGKFEWIWTISKSGIPKKI